MKKLILGLVIAAFCFFMATRNDKTSWEKRYDESINFNKDEVVDKLSNLNLNFTNSKNQIKPRGKFFAFKEFEKGGVGIDYDTDLHLEKDSLLSCNSDSITSFIFYHRDNFTSDAQYQNVTGYRENGRIFFINPKKFEIEYVIQISGNNTPDKVLVRKFDKTTISNGIGPLNIVNAVKE